MLTATRLAELHDGVPALQALHWRLQQWVFDIQIFNRQKNRETRLGYDFFLQICNFYRQKKPFPHQTRKKRIFIFIAFLT